MIAEGLLTGWAQTCRPVILAVFIWSLANCLLGYFAFRILLIANAAVAAVVFGQALAEALRAHPTALDYLVACGGLAAIAAICGWLFPRPAFAAVGGLAVGAAAMLLLGGRPAGPGGWGFVTIASLAATVFSYRYVKWMVVCLAGAIGSIFAVFSAAAMLGWDRSGAFALTALLVLVAMGLAVVGMYCQVFLARRLTHRLAPKRTRNRRAARPTARIHPRFTKI